ncbi:acyltransferase family protein [Saccharospirillum impatiens]|uniref:acyltransferase family protein n=1 Tax=Saccharospirillum impatiens TaxID=169438 RepID=UPI0004049604|nr:acyltransferase [Saccharospirillum impatiens]
MQYPSLESLRGLAAIMVALIHSSFVVATYPPLVEQASIFVDFFFILSGFVMALAYADKIDQGLSFKSFTLLRFGRLYPLHLFMLLLWLPYILLKGYAHFEMGLGGNPFDKNSLSNFLANLFLVNGMGVTETLSWNYPAWSISVEFFTYLVFFAFIATTPKDRKPLLYLLVSLFSYALLYMQTGSSLLSADHFGFPRCVAGFFLGAFVFTQTQGKRLTLKPMASHLLESSVMLAMLFLVWKSHDAKVIQLATFVSFGLLIGVFTLQAEGWLSALLSTAPLMFIGTLSYSIYMTHALIFIVIDNLTEYVIGLPTSEIYRVGMGSLQVFKTPYAGLINLLALALVVAFSYGTYTLIEKPWRARFRRWALERKSLLNPG